ncbi:MAG: hypothetical protein WHS46_04070 [Desulfosoma sp.]
MKCVERFLPVAIFCAMSLFISACAVPRLTSKDHQEPVTFWTPDQWRQTMLERLERWRHFQAGYQAKWTDSLERVWRAKILVTASLPDQLRVEILNTWGQVQGLFLLKDSWATLWVVPEKTVYTSTRHEALLEKLVGIALAGTELAPALLGLPSEKVLEGSLPRRLQDGTVVLAAKESQHQWRRLLTLCSDQERLCGMDFTEAGTSLSVLFRYEAQGNDRDIPSSLTFHGPTGLVELTRTFLDRPASFSPENFELPPLGQTVQVVEIP